MEINIFQVDAFSSNPFGGNPAAVVPNDRWISDIDMQKIANEMNVSETAFVRQIDDDSFRVRFFTTKLEVDLCGHATIATFYTMASKGYIKPIENGKKIATLVTNVEKLPIEIFYKNGLVDFIRMQQVRPKTYGEVVNIDEILDAMNLNKSDIGVLDRFINPEIISTGLPDIILPIRDKSVLDDLNVNFKKLAKASKVANVIGVHAFYLPKIDSEEIYVRNFAPLVRIDEESATGTANGSLIYYLKKNSLISSNQIIALQGESLNRPSKIYCFIEKDENGFYVMVGGTANIVMEGIIKF